MFKVIGQQMRGALVTGVSRNTIGETVGKYVVVRDREHAKAAIESGLLFWVALHVRVSRHWLPTPKTDAEFNGGLANGCWGVLVEEDE